MDTPKIPNNVKRQFSAYSFLRTTKHNPNTDVNIGSFVYQKPNYYYVADMVDDVVLLSKLSHDSNRGVWCHSGKFEIQNVNNLYSVELPDKFTPVKASVLYRGMGANSHTPKKAQSKKPSSIVKKWW